MPHSSRPLALILTACIIWMSTTDALAYPHPSTPPNSAVRRWVELFGAGTEVRLKLTNGKKLQGSLGGLGAGSFELIFSQAHTPLQIDYIDVREFEVRKASFRLSDEASTQQAARVVEGLGVGSRIKVRVTGKELYGNIYDIQERHFKLLPVGKANIINVAYADMRELRPQPRRDTSSGSGWKTYAIAGAVLMLLPLSCRNKSGCLP
jgi:hypothetical protein